MCDIPIDNNRGEIWLPYIVLLSFNIVLLSFNIVLLSFGKGLLD